MEAHSIYETNTNGKVIYVRHGETYYNLESKTSKSGVKAHPSYIDSSLTAKGVSQANEVSKTIAKISIDKVYTSPLLRCLQTTFFALENHPNVASITVLVHPLIIEIVGGMQDWSHDTKAKKEKYNLNSKVKFDWSLFDALYEGDMKRELFCLEHADLIDDSLSAFIKEAEDHFLNDNKQELAKTISNLIKEGLINRKLSKFESLQHVFNRNLQFKQHLLKDITSPPLSENKILVFTHSGFVMLSTSRLAYDMSAISKFPSDVYEMKNCECISMIINEHNCAVNSK